MRLYVLISCLLAGMAAATFAQKELTSAYYEDLGPEEIDVSSYPPEQQRRYAVFKNACSQCHTLARPVNSPVSTRRAWRRYIVEMKLYDKLNRRAKLTKSDANEVVEFLAYDGMRRKIKDRENFDILTQDLQRRYWHALENRMSRLQNNPPLLAPEAK